MLGAEVGLKPYEIYNMEYWEFNFYLKGYREHFYKQEVDLMKLAYNTGMLSRETKHKPKSLEHYLEKIDKKYHGNPYRNAPVDVKKSREIYEKIQKMKGSDGNGK